MNKIGKLRLFLFLQLCLAMSAGCHGPQISGVVETVQGEALPGVAVRVTGTQHTALTNALGRYAVGYDPGAVTIDFMKSGYTPGVLALEAAETPPDQVVTVRLWPLPANQGVFLSENNRYYALETILPDKYTTADGALYGTRKELTVETRGPHPLLICYKLPRGSLRMTRMDRRKIAVEEKGARKTDIEAWVPSDPVPVVVLPIDEPKQWLAKIELPGSLANGTYAIHWGALNGIALEEARAFLFQVNAPEATTAPDKGAADKGAADITSLAAPPVATP
jgi:hypothetical protein